MTVRTVLRGTGRGAVAVLVAGVVALCGLQFEHIVAKNVALAQQLASSRERTVLLRERIVDQERAIARLSTPGGAVPEIHDELQLVRPNEEVIYVRGAAPATPEPDWSAP
jgi:hypothetical protein